MAIRQKSTPSAAAKKKAAVKPAPKVTTPKEPEPETTVTDAKATEDGRVIVTCSNGFTYQVGDYAEVPALLKALG